MDRIREKEKGKKEKDGSKESNESSSSFSQVVSSVYSWVSNLSNHLSSSSSESQLPPSTSPSKSIKLNPPPSSYSSSTIIESPSPSKDHRHRHQLEANLKESSHDHTNQIYLKNELNISPPFGQIQIHAPSPVQLDEDFDRIRYERTASSELLSSSDLTIQLINRQCSKEDETLTVEMATQLRRHLPAHCRYMSTWTLVYSTVQHGFSLNTLYNQCKSVGTNPVILVIRDDYGQIFGSFCSEPWQPHLGHFGTGECFLFKFDEKNQLKVFPSTGKNSYFLIAEPDFIAVGCGNGKFGIYLDSELLKGQSNKVPTFDNQILSTNVDFICIGIELWTFSFDE